MNTIDIKVGIYDTEAKVTFHRDGTATVRAPYVKWSNNTGSLAFERVHITDASHVRNLRDLINGDDAQMFYGELIGHYQ